MVLNSLQTATSKLAPPTRQACLQPMIVYISVHLYTPVKGGHASNPAEFHSPDWEHKATPEDRAGFVLSSSRRIVKVYSYVSVLEQCC